MMLDTKPRSLSEKQKEAARLSNSLTKSLTIENLIPNIFDKGSFKLRLISSQNVYNCDYVKLQDGTSIVSAEAIYKDGSKLTIDLDVIAKLKNGRYFNNKKG